MILQRPNSSLCLATVLVAFVAWAGGCDQSPKGAKHADGRFAERTKPGEAAVENPAKKPATASEQPAVNERSDSPSHPAVSTQVGPVDEAPEADPTEVDAPPSNPPSNASSDKSPDESATASNGKRVAIPTPPPGALPQIALTASHRATCKVFVGDTLPPRALADLDGNAAPLDKHFGARLTLIVFWQHADADAVETLSDLGPLVLSPYGGRGVRAVAIHAGEVTDEVKSLAQRYQAAFPVLVDADGAALGQVAGAPLGLMPRIFLVDATGRILWFDIEYSRTTRRDLDAALRYLTRP